MIDKASQLKDKALLAVLLSVAVACGSVDTQEVAQSKAVRDRARVLGLALMDDGTYQFRLCRLHKTYTAEILANECVNPLVNEDGTERVFRDVPGKPGTKLAKFRNWVTAGLGATIAGVLIYKIGRFYVKTKARDRLTGRAMWESHIAEVEGAKAGNDFVLAKQLGELKKNVDGDGGEVFAKNSDAITFAEKYAESVEGNIEKARKAIKDASSSTLKVDEETGVDKITEAEKLLQDAYEALQPAEDSGFNSKPIRDLAQEIAALKKKLEELRDADAKELGGKLEAIERDADTIYKRVHSKEGLRLLSGEGKAALADADESSDVGKAWRTWKHRQEELSLLDGENSELARLKRELVDLKKADGSNSSEIREVESRIEKVEREINKVENVFVGLKFGKDELVEKLVRIDDVVKRDDPDHLGSGEKTILKIKQDIEKYREAAKEAGDKKVKRLNENKLNETLLALKERIKSYNPSQRRPKIDAQQEKVGAAIKSDPVTERAEAAAEQARAERDEGGGLFAGGLDRLSLGIKGSVKFLRGFPWLGKDTLKYSKLNKITVTDEDKIVDKLARDVEVKDIEVQKGIEKLAAQVVGVSAFLSLPLTDWSRYLPAHALLTAEKNWTEVTGGYAAAKRIDDMLTILDGIAQATNSRVAPAAINFGL